MRHFGFALDFSEIDLWNIDLLDTHLDLLDSRRLQDMSSRHLQDMSSSCFEDVFNVTIFRLPRRLQDVSEDVKLLRWRRIEDVFKTRLQDQKVLAGM